MADGLEPTETLTSFEKYDELGVNDDHAGSGDECDQCSQFQISSKLERAEKRGGPCSPLGNRSTQNSDVDDDRDTEDDQVKDYKSGSNICGNNRWNAVGSS